MGAVNYWSKRLNHGQGPFVAAEWSTAARRERQRAGKLFLPSGDWGEERRGRREEIGGTAAHTHTQPCTHTGPIGGQTLRVLGSIWKATLCLALYCTPCCFNQWQACSQGLEQRQQRLFLIVSLLLPLSPAPLHTNTLLPTLRRAAWPFSGLKMLVLVCACGKSS